MTANPNYLIYLVYGSEDIQAEAVYSILSYYKITCNDAKVIVYTDSIAFLKNTLRAFPEIIYPVVTPAQWQSWRGSSNKVYLLKIGVLNHAAQHFPGNLLFVDTDTIWRADPALIFSQIEQGAYVMHVSEGALYAGNPLSRKVYKNLKKHVFQVDYQAVKIDKETVLYNSGVLGLTSATALQLAKVTALADEMYALYNKHMMEQLAFSLWFTAKGSVVEASPYLVHYWNIKEIRPVLVKLFRRYSVDEFYERVTTLHLAAMHEAEMHYRQLPNWHRTLLKAVGRQWKIKIS